MKFTQKLGPWLLCTESFDFALLSQLEIRRQLGVCSDLEDKPDEFLCSAIFNDSFMRFVKVTFFYKLIC